MYNVMYINSSCIVRRNLDWGKSPTCACEMWTVHAQSGPGTRYAISNICGDIEKWRAMVMRLLVLK